MSKRGSKTTLKYLTKKYYSTTSGVKSTKGKLMKLQKGDSLETIIFKFKNLSTKNRRFIELWDAFDGNRTDTIGYFYGSFKIFSDNFKKKEYEIFGMVKDYLKNSENPDLFDYLKKYLNLKRK